MRAPVGAPATAAGQVSARRPKGVVEQGTTGRGLASIPRPAAQSVPDAPAADPGSPFGRFAPSADEMHREADKRRDDSLGLVAIVGGLLFMMASAAVVAVAVLLVGLWVTTRGGGDLAGATDDADHIRDTGMAEVGPERRKAAPAGPAPEEEVDDPLATGPQPGPATLIIPPEALFFTVEINCPGGFRGRGKFKNGKATVYNVPPDEKCTVTFQGSTFAKTYISGHQTKMCTQFEPTPVCRLR